MKLKKLIARLKEIEKAEGGGDIEISVDYSAHKDTQKVLKVNCIFTGEEVYVNLITDSEDE